MRALRRRPSGDGALEPPPPCHVGFEDYVRERESRDRSVHRRALLLFPPERHLIPSKDLPLVQEFRKQIGELGWSGSYWDNSLVAWRYLCARDYDVAAAVGFFESDMAWRKEKNLATLVNTAEYGVVPKHLVQFKLAEIEAIRAVRRIAAHKTDREGRPIIYDRAGSLSVRAMRDITTPERFFDYVVWFQEAMLTIKLPAASLHAGRPVTKIVCIFDLSGFKLSNFTAEYRALLKQIASIGIDHYPETLHHTYIVNSPASFRVVWAFAKLILPPSILAAITVCGGQRDYLPRLLRDVCDKQNLPSFLGGDDDSLDWQQEVGPWAAYLPSLLPQEDRAVTLREEPRPAHGVVCEDEEYETFV